MPTKLTSKQADKLIEAAQNAVLFMVEGRGDFPHDMLRYDLCWPAYERDSYSVKYANPMKDPSVRQINLKGLKLPTAARWESFGWRVVPA